MASPQSTVCPGGAGRRVQDPPDLDAVFDLGLRLILDGLAQRLPAATRQTS